MIKNRKCYKIKKDFTLIELIAVLVILAILALIVTPLVMNIIRKARIAADRRSIDAYGRSIEIAMANKILDSGKSTVSIEDLAIEYKGREVKCDVKFINADGGVYLSKCMVAGKYVFDDTEDGYYHYGVAKYLSYKIGDKIKYNNEFYYVIKNSPSSEKSVTLLKANHLTEAEVNLYGGVGTINNHVNLYTPDYESGYQKAKANGGMSYYSKSDCKASNTSGCTNDYQSSDIKYVVDGWAESMTNEDDLVADDLGYKVRLITYDELVNNLGYEVDENYHYIANSTEQTPSFIKETTNFFWTMSPGSEKSFVWSVGNDGRIMNESVSGSYCSVVRPVINLKKIAIQS